MSDTVETTTTTESVPVTVMVPEEAPKEETTVNMTKIELNEDENTPAIAESDLPTKPIIETPIRQRTRVLRQLWSEYRKMAAQEYSQLIFIAIISAIAVLFNITAISTNYWLSDSNNNMSLWATCYKSTKVINSNETLVDIEVTNVTDVKTEILCGKQTVNGVVFEAALQSRIDQISASQGLIVAGIVLYVFSIVSVMLAFKFTKETNLNSVRNAMVTSMFIQIVSFYLQLIGFFLYVFTDQLASSVIYLFVYFCIAIFATNMINFITIEYKSIKYRPVVTVVQDNWPFAFFA